MRIWDIPPKLLCTRHLNGEHREIHALAAVLINPDSPYMNHPETKRWIGREDELRLRHKMLESAMRSRGGHPKTPMDGAVAGSIGNMYAVDNMKSQIENLWKKRWNEKHVCTCDIGLIEAYAIGMELVG